MATFLCLSGFGSLNVKIYTASRVTQAAAERGHLPGFLVTVPRIDNDERPESRADDETERKSGVWEYLQRPTPYKDGTIPLYDSTVVRL